MSFEGKRVLVTGGSRGIGRATAKVFREAGARVAVNGRTTESTAEGIAALGDDGLIAASGDVDTVASCQAVVDAALDAFGGLDVLVNSAGVAKARTIETCDEALWNQVIDINLKGTFNACKAFARPLMKRGGAAIINITSVVGVSGNAGQANYAASKGGVIALTKSLAKELATRQVRVNAVAPGFIATDMTAELADADRDAMLGSIALGRLGETADIARLVVAVAGSPGAYITGQTIVIDGGMMI